MGKEEDGPEVDRYDVEKSKEAKALGKIAKLRKWEPVRRRATQNEVSVDKIGIDIFAWAAKHFRGHKGADLYVDDKMGLLGIKPTAKGQRSLISKAGGERIFHLLHLAHGAGRRERKEEGSGRVGREGEGWSST